MRLIDVPPEKSFDDYQRAGPPVKAREPADRKVGKSEDR
jgi:hypothetical protein